VAAAADATPVRTRLPAALPLLIGRSDDLAALGTLIDQHRLITIVGAGGMGKTRVAQALLHLRAAAAPHGVCWVELALPSQSRT
jgi:ABC-type microcin C transport system duplicated ATPase subunit YejF